MSSEVEGIIVSVAQMRQGAQRLGWFTQGHEVNERRTWGLEPHLGPGPFLSPKILLCSRLAPHLTHNRSPQSETFLYDDL